MGLHLKVMHLLSSITSGVWAMKPDAANGYLGFAVKVLKGETPAAPEDWKERREASLPRFFEVNSSAVTLYSGVGMGVYNLDLLRSAPEGSIAHMSVEGPITQNGQQSGAMGTKERVRVLNAIRGMDNIAGVVTYFDTPGGAADGLREYFDAIQAISAAGKETTALVDSAFSAGYYMAAAHNRILAVNKMSQFGSIGTYITLMDVSGFFEKEGIRMEDIYATESTEKNGPYRAWLDGDKGPVTQMVDRYREDFVSAVKEGRGEGLSESALKGAAYFAPEAESLGLFDGYASLEESVLITIEAGNQRREAAQNQAIMDATEKLSTSVASKVMQALGFKPNSEEKAEEEILPQDEPIEAQTEEPTEAPEEEEEQKPEEAPEGALEEEPAEAEAVEAITARTEALQAENAELERKVELQERLNAAKAAAEAVSGDAVKGHQSDKPVTKRPPNAEQEGLKALGERFAKQFN